MKAEGVAEVITVTTGAQIAEDEWEYAILQKTRQDQKKEATALCKILSEEYDFPRTNLSLQVTDQTQA